MKYIIGCWPTRYDSEWQTTENNREAKYYTITRAGIRALESQTERWRRLAGLVDKLLLHES